MKKIFSEEHKQFIKNNASGLRNEELTRRLNKEFGTEFTVGQIKKFKNYNHISSGFKSCNLPIGSERVNKGYIFIKIAEPNVWIEKHRYIYESVYGKIPAGHKVIFADQDKGNFDINNLILVTDSEALIMNTNKLIYKDAELTKTASIVAKIIDKTNKLNRAKEV